MARRSTRWDKRDANEPEIIAALEKAGCIVWKKLRLDLIVFTPDGEIVVPEIKTKYGRLTDGQKEDIEALARLGIHVPILRSPEDALKAIGRI